MIEDGCQHRQSEEAKIKSLSIRNGVHIEALEPNLSICLIYRFEIEIKKYGPNIIAKKK